MKPTTPEQLVRFVDQVSTLYPNGIPVGLAKAVAPPPTYHLIVVGAEGEMPQGELELLVAIAIKGLKASADAYAVTYLDEREAHSQAMSSRSANVIVFGAAREYGWVVREGQKPALFTSSLSQLMTDASLKRELWRCLQTLI